MKGNFSPILNNQTKDINSQVSMLAVLQKFGIEVKRSSTKYNCLCPLHGDKETPSFYVVPETNSWICYGKCLNPVNPGKHNGGDVIAFVMQYNKQSYPEAVKWIEDNFFLTNKKQVSSIKFKKKIELPNIADETIAYYHSLLDLNTTRDWFIKERGFTNKTINEQALGFDGTSHVIPIWEGEPRTSACLCIKLRSHKDNGPKYVRFGSYKPYLYNTAACRDASIVYMFAGELDALLASQDGLTACSVINGAKSILELPKNWPDLFFPKAQQLTVIFDRKEEIAASTVLKSWDKIKGKFTSKLFQWPYFGGSDYTDYRIKYGHSFKEFKELL